MSGGLSSSKIYNILWNENKNFKRKEIIKIINDLLNLMNQELKKNKTFKFFNFGKFFLTETKSKNIRKIYSKEIIKSTPKKKIKFNASKKNKF